MINSIEAKKILPIKSLQFAKLIYFKINKLLIFFDRTLIRIAILSPFLSSFYYVLISSQFRREQHSVVFGRFQYYKNLQLGQSNPYLLRRNIHRLEKGLIMRPRRDIFAVGYIEETVRAYCHAFEKAGEFRCGDSDLSWANDVLSEYFRIAGSHSVINQSKQKFLSLAPLKSKGQCIPYKRDLDKPISVSYTQFLELCHRRRSVRWYTQDPVPRELLDQAITAAALSPSACNRQPFEFRVFDKPDLVQKIASVPGGTKGFQHNFPVIIVVVGKLRAYFNERDRHVIYIDGSLASMSLIYALETLGLSSCSINWPDVDQKEKQMANLLSLEADERIVMLISVGYPDPDALVPYSSKKPLDQIRRYN
ncbi:nitroreductase [Leptolyngbya sp. PCC 7375]|nr:nitroreductase [Leptolyngbya sp. PCC 7375]